MTLASIESLLPQLACLPPHTHALGLRFGGLEPDGAVVLTAPYREDLIGDPDTRVLASGLVSALLDHAGGLAVWAALKAFQPIATVDLRVDYMRGSKPGLDIHARARCFHLTRRIAFVRAWAYDESPDEPIAAAQGAYTLTPRRPGRHAPPQTEGDQR
ncbi:MAG: PaaI family thioesterase [Brevundimonas sp.]|uniref:PaaI family thioesterase n=1 Tax=Brevundimonas sp. TaxID=1871086 RepID=UPI00391CF9FC